MSQLITTRGLRYFIVVAEELSFSRAAERLGIAQSALSQQIKILEDALGFRLFERTRPLALTAAARFFQGEAGEMLERLEASVANGRAIDLGHRKWLAIGFSRSAMYSFLPPVIRAFRERHPDVELRLFEMASDFQPEALRNGRIHIGVARDLPVVLGLRAEEVLVEDLVLGLSRDNPLAVQSEEGEEVELAELDREPFVLFPRDRLSLYRRRILAACESVGFLPSVAQEADEVQTALGLVAAGFGISIVTRDVATYGHVNLAFRPLTIGGARFMIKTLAVTVDRPLSTAEEGFINILKLKGEGQL